MKVVSSSTQTRSSYLTNTINSGLAMNPMPIGTPFFSSHICMLIIRCSWEPEENLETCQRLRESFWKHVGMDNDDYAIGYEVAAKDDWIG